MNPAVITFAIGLAFAAAGLPGCASSGSAPAESHPAGVPVPHAGREAVVAPDRCRLLCSVLAIDSLRESSGPCSKAPCTAVVRIDSILAYGFSFPPVLRVGQTIKARFAFTTQRSGRWFPALTKQYPGIRTGSHVVADAALSGTADAPSSSSGLMIDDYALRSEGGER